MDLKIKLLELFERSYYLIVIAREIIDSEALKRLVTDVQEITRPLLHCKVFIDFEEASLHIRPAAINSMADHLKLHLNSNQINMAVVATEFDRCGRLQLLRDLLSSQDLRVAVFDHTKTAASWLSDGIGNWRPDGSFQTLI